MQHVTTKAFAMVGITKEEFFSSGGGATADAVMRAVKAAWRSSMMSVQSNLAEGVRIDTTHMVVLIRDAFAEGSVEGFEDYVTLLFINRPVQEICRQAGVRLNIIHECDEESLPSPIGRLVALPLYSKLPKHN